MWETWDVVAFDTKETEEIEAITQKDTYCCNCKGICNTQYVEAAIDSSKDLLQQEPMLYQYYGKHYSFTTLFTSMATYNLTFYIGLNHTNARVATAR